MTRKRKPVLYELDAGGIRELPEEDIRMILRAADELIYKGGRNLLAKILKGSKEKKVLELNLDKCPAYGYYHDRKLEYVMKCIDFCILSDYLDIFYNGNLPMIIFGEKGWDIEKQTYAEECYQSLKNMKHDIDQTKIDTLLHADRQVITILIDIAIQDHDTELEPVLLEWQSQEVKKVRAMISRVIRSYHQEEVQDENS